MLDAKLDKNWFNTIKKPIEELTDLLEVTYMSAVARSYTLEQLE